MLKQLLRFLPCFKKRSKPLPHQAPSPDTESEGWPDSSEPLASSTDFSRVVVFNPEAPKRVLSWLVSLYGHGRMLGDERSGKQMLLIGPGVYFDVVEETFSVLSDSVGHQVLASLQEAGFLTQEGTEFSANALLLYELVDGYVVTKVHGIPEPLFNALKKTSDTATLPKVFAAAVAPCVAYTKVTVLAYWDRGLTSEPELSFAYGDLERLARRGSELVFPTEGDESQNFIQDRVIHRMAESFWRQKIWLFDMLEKLRP